MFLLNVTSDAFLVVVLLVASRGRHWDRHATLMLFSTTLMSFSSLLCDTYRLASSYQITDYFFC